MENSEKEYFEKMMNYQSPKIKTPFKDSEQDIDYFSSRIRNLAKDALIGDISPNNTKKEISDLLKTIKELNQSAILTN